MLSDPQYNDIIPTIVNFSDLSPEVEALDLRRLNQDLTDNKQLLKIVNRIGHGNTDIPKTLEDLRAIPQTPEVRAVQLYFEHASACARTLPKLLRKKQKRDPATDPDADKKAALSQALVPQNLLMFIEENQLKSYLIDRLLVFARTDQARKEKISNYYKLLNYLFFDDFVWSLNPRLGFRPASNYVDFMEKNAEALVPLKRCIEIQRVAVLLGNPEPKYFYSMVDAFNSIENTTQTNYSRRSDSRRMEAIDQLVSATQHCNIFDKPIHVFLIYLTLTRNPDREQFENVRSLLEEYFTVHGRPDLSRNGERFERIKQFFS